MRADGPRGVPILTYHSLDDSGSVISVTPDAFRGQMRLLEDHGQRGIALGELLDVWERGAEPPKGSVVLTFDDGYRSLADVAQPALAERGFRATVFAVAGRCGESNDWPGQPGWVPRLPLLEMAELRRLADAGFEVGSHGYHHAPLSEADPLTLQRELVESRAVLEDGLGRPVRLFAYAYGRAGRAARELARAHYRAACGVRLGRARRERDRHDLARIDVYYLRPQPFFARFDTRFGRAYLALRALGRGLRQAVS